MRFALQALKGLPKYLLKDISKGDLALRLGQDALGGMMAAAYTPGDLGDKAIAGIASTVGGAAGGLALGKLGGSNQLLGLGLDMGGSIAGDMLASRVGEEVMKGKSYVMGEGYATPWEKMSNAQQEQLAQAIRNDVLRQYGLMVPGAPVEYAMDPTTGMGVS